MNSSSAYSNLRPACFCGRSSYRAQLHLLIRWLMNLHLCPSEALMVLTGKVLLLRMLGNVCFRST